MASTQAGMHNLVTLIKRLEAATSRLEDIAASTNGVEPAEKSASIARSTGGVTGPATAASVAASPAAAAAPAPPAPGKAASPVDKPRSIADFDLMMSDDLQPFISLSNKIGGLVAEQAGLFATAFAAQEQVLWLASKAKKPSETSPVFMEIFKDLVQGQEKVTAVREKNRKSPQDNHLAMLADGVGVLFWVVQPNKPDDYVGEILGGARMYGNRLLTAFKDKDQLQVDWVTSFVKLCGSLKAYIAQHYRQGLIWNANGVSPEEGLKEVRAQHSAGVAPPAPAPPAAGGPPPPPPPPPPMPTVEQLEGSAAPAAATGGAGAMGSVFADINRGEGVTSGLRKVDKSQMTHKNPSLRNAPPVPARKDSAGSSRGKSPAPNKKPDTMRTKKSSKKVLEGNKWTIENFENETTPVSIEAEQRHSLLISRCNKAQFLVNGKANAITVDNCKRVDIIVDTLVSSIEVINCQNFRVQVTGTVPVIQLDKVDNSAVILSKESIETAVYTSKCSGINIDLPPASESEDSVECPVPEQFKSYIKNGKLVTEVVLQENS